MKTLTSYFLTFTESFEEGTSANVGTGKSYVLTTLSYCEAFVQMLRGWEETNAHTPQSKRIKTILEHILLLSEKYHDILFDGQGNVGEVSVDIPEGDLEGKKFSTMLRRTEEFQEIKKSVVKGIDKTQGLKQSSLNLRVFTMCLYEYLEQLVDAVE